MEQVCDRGKGLETSTIKMEVTRSLFSSVCWDEIFSSEKKKNLNFEIKISRLKDLHARKFVLRHETILDLPSVLPDQN